MTTVAKINSGKRALLQKKGRELIVYFKKLKGTDGDKLGE